jgi:hypothetical protein
VTIISTKFTDERLDKAEKVLEFSIPSDLNALSFREEGGEKTLGNSY